MGVSIWHILIIVLVVLLFFGPSRLPGLGKSIGEAIRGFKKGLDDNEIDVTNSSEKIQSGKDQSADGQKTNTHQSDKNKA